MIHGDRVYSWACWQQLDWIFIESPFYMKAAAFRQMKIIIVYEIRKQPPWPFRKRFLSFWGTLVRTMRSLQRHMHNHQCWTFASCSLLFNANKGANKTFASCGVANSDLGLTWWTLVSFDRWTTNSKDVCVVHPTNWLQTSKQRSVCLSAWTAHTQHWQAIFFFVCICVCVRRQHW